MNEENYNANAYEDFMEVKDEITAMVDIVADEIFDKYGFRLVYSDIYTPDPYNNILYIT